MRQPLLTDEDGGAPGGLGGRHVQVRNHRTLSQVPGARDKAERAERAVVAHSNMTSAEAARRSTVLVSEQRLAHAATAAGASARRRSAGTAGPDELEVSCGRSRVQAAQPGGFFHAVRRRRGAQILRSRHRTH